MTSSSTPVLRSSEPPTEPVCWIDRLPEELKSEIAQNCYEQDRRDRELYWRTLYAYGPRKLVESLGAPFRTSHLWARICAPCRFQDVTFRQILMKTFRLQVARRRGSLFQRVIGDHSSPRACSEWLAYIDMPPFLPNVSSVELALFGDFLVNERCDDDTATAADMAQLRLRRTELIPKAVTDFLARCTHFDFDASLFVGPMLSAISPLPAETDRPITVKLTLDDSSWLPNVLDHLAPPPELERLELDISIANFLFDGDLMHPVSTTLRHLAIHLHTCDTDIEVAIRLAVTHRESLTSLEITWLRYWLIEEEHPDPIPRFPQHPFPRLRMLNLAFGDAISAEALTVFLDSVTLDRFPSVRTVRLRTVELGNLQVVAPSFADLVVQPGVVFVHEGPIVA